MATKATCVLAAAFASLAVGTVASVTAQGYWIKVGEGRSSVEVTYFFGIDNHDWYNWDRLDQ